MRRTLSLVVAVAALALVGASPAHAAIAFRNQATGNNGAGSTSLTVSRPPGTQTGDVMLASVNTGGVLPATAPAGWTLINSGTGPGFAAATYWRAAAAGEPTSYAWTFGSSTQSIGWIASYSGVNTTYPIGDYATSGGTGATATAPSATPAARNVMVVVGVGYNAPSATTVTSPAGTTQRTSAINGTVGVAVADFSQTSSADTPAKAFTFSVAPAVWGTQATVLTPAGGTLSFGTAPALGTFSPVTLNGSSQSSTRAMPNFMVDDETGSKAGWNVTVQGDGGAGKSAVFKAYCPNATCGTDTAGYVAAGPSLPAGSLTLNSTGASFTGGSNGAPSLRCDAGCAIDSAAPVSIASATAGTGTAQWTTTGFSASSLSLATPSTLRALKTNEVYRANVVWTLNSGP